MTTDRNTQANANGIDALDALRAEHRALLQLFDKLAHADELGRRGVERKLATSACHALLAHSRLEWELFYPALRAASALDELVDDARVEHRMLDELVVELSHANPRDEGYRRKIAALKTYLAHHFQEEEERLFPRARRFGLDLHELAKRIAARNAQLETKR